MYIHLFLTTSLCMWNDLILNLYFLLVSIRHHLLLLLRLRSSSLSNLIIRLLVFNLHLIIIILLVLLFFLVAFLLIKLIIVNWKLILIACFGVLGWNIYLRFFLFINWFEHCLLHRRLFYLNNCSGWLSRAIAWRRSILWFVRLFCRRLVLILF